MANLFPFNMQVRGWFKLFFAIPIWAAINAFFIAVYIGAGTAAALIAWRVVMGW
jgi:hypothetical protein